MINISKTGCSKPTILLTGATGYIGSHIWCTLLEEEYQVIGLDNLSNSKIDVVDKIAQITKKDINFIQGDILDCNLLDKLFSSYAIDAVIHLASLKLAHESVIKPIEYYQTNIYGLTVLCQIMLRYKVNKLIYSSTAAVYGDKNNDSPVHENDPLHPKSPYAESKLVGERLLTFIHQSNPSFQFGILRYFNPVGAHKSRLIYENPVAHSGNLFSTLIKVAERILDKIYIYGADYPTLDGTGIRDYIHITDLAEGHVAAVKKLLNNNMNFTVNLGTGKGYSVLAVLNIFEQNIGRQIPYEIEERRLHDIAISYADVSHSAHLLSWTAIRGINEMCIDAWAANHPKHRENINVLDKMDFDTK